MNQIPNSAVSQSFWLTVNYFEIPYLLKSWDLYCACHPGCSARFLDHMRALLVQV
jgi:hypothetical protein